MEYKEIDYIINSQIKFTKTNSNSVNYRIQILNSLLKAISKNEFKIYDALKKDLNKHEFESFLSEVLLVKREIKLFLRKLRKWSKMKKVNGSIFNFPSSNLYFCMSCQVLIFYFCKIIRILHKICVLKNLNFRSLGETVGWYPQIDSWKVPSGVYA